MNSNATIMPEVTPAPPLLNVRDLSVTFCTAAGPLPALEAVSLAIRPGETLAVVGESGSGKSVLALALMGLLPPAARIEATEMSFGGTELTAIAQAARRRLRGRDMAMIFQEPATALNPVRRIGDQLVEAILLHDPMPLARARDRAVAALAATRIPDAEIRAQAYPHELSGGMRQRALIAMALIHRPRLLIADEPTTALDVTVQAQILDLIRDLASETGTATIFITHDMGVVAEMADRVAVLYAGRMVETAAAADLFDCPEHPYTLGLMGSLPELTPRGRPLLSIAGTVPDLRSIPSGCHFHPRCPFADSRCVQEQPRMRFLGSTRAVACHHAPLMTMLGSTP